MKRWAWLITAVTSLLILVAIVSVVKYLQNTKPAIQPAHELPLERPIVRITDPQRGPKDAPITIVYFADFACESCAYAWPLVQALEKEPDFKGKLRFVWKDLPEHRTIYPESLVLHKAARCAASQGKFWEFQEAAFTKGQEIRLRHTVLKDVLAASGLNGSSVQSCIDSQPIQNLIDENITEARRLGITGTPIFFLNEKRFEGVPQYAMMVGNIRNMLARIEYDKTKSQ